MKNFKGVWIPYEILTDKKLNDKENTKEVLFRKIIPVNKIDNTYKQICTIPIIKNVKDIKYNNKINNKDNCNLENGRDYSNFDWKSLYANNF